MQTGKFQISQKYECINWKRKCSFSINFAIPQRSMFQQNTKYSEVVNEDLSQNLKSDFWLPWDKKQAKITVRDKKRKWS